MPGVLIVEDNEDIRFLIRRALQSRGFETSEAKSGVEALERLASGELPDLIVLDIQMPGLDGWDTLKTIRRQAATTDLPVVICTVKASPDSRIKGLRLGCDGYIKKPFDMKEIGDQVTATLARSSDERRSLREAAMKHSGADNGNGDPG